MLDSGAAAVRHDAFLADAQKRQPFEHWKLLARAGQRFRLRGGSFA